MKTLDALYYCNANGPGKRSSVMSVTIRDKLLWCSKAAATRTAHTPARPYTPMHQILHNPASRRNNITRQISRDRKICKLRGARIDVLHLGIWKENLTRLQSHSICEELDHVQLLHNTSFKFVTLRLLGARRTLYMRTQAARTRYGSAPLLQRNTTRSTATAVLAPQALPSESMSTATRRDRHTL